MSIAPRPTRPSPERRSAPGAPSPRGRGRVAFIAALACGLLVVAGGLLLLRGDPTASELTASGAASAGADVKDPPAGMVEGGATQPPASAGGLRRGTGTEGGQLLEPRPGAPAGRASLRSTGSEDGQLHEPASPFDLSLPAIATLDPALLQAVQQAARDASEDGVEFVVTSGWRSAAYQQRLLDDAISEYGNLDEALRYVATPDTSAHVTGEAVDIGPTDADSWLSQHGADYGLCQTYANEMWHFELATTPGGECPTMRSDASS